MLTKTRAVPGVQNFPLGARVRHKIYGEGTVVSPDRYTRGDMIRVRFDGPGDVRVIAQSIWTT